MWVRHARETRRNRYVRIAVKRSHSVVLHCSSVWSAHCTRACSAIDIEQTVHSCDGCAVVCFFSEFGKKYSSLSSWCTSAKSTVGMGECDLDRALDWLTQYVEDPPRLVLAADELVYQGDTVDAIQLLVLRTHMNLGEGDDEVWYRLGVLGGFTWKHVTYDAQRCLVRCLERNMRHYRAWKHAGALGGCTIRGVHYTPQECCQQSLRLSNYGYDHAWNLQAMILFRDAHAHRNATDKCELLKLALECVEICVRCNPLCREWRENAALISDAL